MASIAHKLLPFITVLFHPGPSIFAETVHCLSLSEYTLFFSWGLHDITALLDQYIDRLFLTSLSDWELDVDSTVSDLPEQRIFSAPEHF